MESYSKISDLDLFTSKLNYINLWQSLRHYGITYFAIRVKGSRFKEELLGVKSDRLIRISPEGEALKFWLFSSMKTWNVNWEINEFEFSFDDESLEFKCLSCDAKILHEFIGGYIYLSIRPDPKKYIDNNNSRSNFNEDMFFRLTEKR